MEGNLTKERLLTIAYNAISLLEENNLSYEEVLEEVSLSENEYKEIMENF